MRLWASDGEHIEDLAAFARAGQVAAAPSGGVVAVGFFNGVAALYDADRATSLGYLADETVEFSAIMPHQMAHRGQVAGCKSANDDCRGLEAGVSADSGNHWGKGHNGCIDEKHLAL